MNTFEVMFRVMMDDVDIELFLVVGAQKILRKCRTPQRGVTREGELIG